MSPEAIMYVEIKGAKQNYLKQGRASDVWSLGCILYRFVYLQPPFGSLPLMGKIRCITDPNHEIPYPPTEDPNIVQVLKGCLIYDPKKRFKIPELLNHPFLKPSKSLTADMIAHILKRGLQMEINTDNYEQVLKVFNYLTKIIRDELLPM
jgi:serine/threonine-protein kinase TTK/MPS1